MPSTDHAVILRPGEHLAEQAVSSPNGEYSFVHQHDGNIVIYRSVDREAIWAANCNYQGQPDLRSLLHNRAGSRPGRLELRENGELVVLKADGEQVWSAGASDGRLLVLQDTGKALLLDARGETVWESPLPAPLMGQWTSVPDGKRLRRGQVLRGQTLTSENGRYILVSTQEGFLYLRQVGGPILWIHHLEWLHGLELTESGRLEDRDWENGYVQAGFLGIPQDLRAAEMFVADDGRLSFADESGTVLWASAPPQEAGPYPGKPQPRAEIDLTGYEKMQSLVVRTDFSDEAAWNELTKLINEWESDEDENEDESQDDPDEEAGFENLFLINDPVWAGAEPAEVVAALLTARVGLPDVVFIADAEAMQEEKQTLAVDLYYEQRPDDLEDPEDFTSQFRIDPDQVGSMTANLGLGNNWFSDWSD
ncbi:DUF6924 domain-containing protein [Kineosporia babensis]|uniref:Bulb-type lectin domain-containing protein n=1 Tax=Kineosporia babensis TaxID=499548 RepID=A0A9X1SYL2_9ACTN|nr:hypothetical protein [Kineosporia babensis]MCD5316465.1 hypothetical protein [Kineosporia babensis]